MLNDIFVRTCVIERLRQNVLSTYLEQLATQLDQSGYSSNSIQNSLCAGAKFGFWLQQQGYSASNIDEQLLQRYRDGIARYANGQLCKASVGLTHLFQLLRQQGVVKPIPPSTKPADLWLDRYEHYLKHVAGLAESTRQSYGHTVKQFLNAYWGYGNDLSSR